MKNLNQPAYEFDHNLESSVYLGVLGDDPLESSDSIADEEDPPAHIFDRSATTYPYQDEISRTPLLNAVQEKELGLAIRKGDQRALQRLVESNLRLVISIAKHYRNQGMELEDLIQEGTVGLVQAARKFDPDLGYRFSTYATWWIRQAVARAVANKGRAIRLPVHLRSNLQKIKKVSKYYHQHLGRYPTLPELKASTGIPSAEIARLLESNLTLLSLDEFASGQSDDRKKVEDYIESNQPSPEYLAEQTLLKAAVKRVSRLLTSREWQAVSYFYGLAGVEMNTGEIALRMNLPVEEVRRMIRRSLKRLKRHLRGTKETMADFLD